MTRQEERTPDIADEAVTLAKMANLPANTIIGNATASPATPQALTASSIIAWVGGMLKAVYDPRSIEHDVFVQMTKIEPASPFKGMLWYDTAGDIVVGLIFTTSDNSSGLGVI